MNDLEILIPLAPFLMVVAIVVVPAWLKSRERKEMQATLRTAIEKGQPLPPEVIDALSRDNIKAPATAGRDLRVGVILLASVLACSRILVLPGWPDNHDGVACFQKVEIFRLAGSSYVAVSADERGRLHAATIDVRFQVVATELRIDCAGETTEIALSARS